MLSDAATGTARQPRWTLKAGGWKRERSSALIRIRIKRQQFHVKSWSKSDSRDSKRSSFIAYIAVDSRRGRRPQIATEVRYKQVTGRKHFILLEVDSAISSILYVHLCVAVFRPHLCPRILMSTFMHVWIHGSEGCSGSAGSRVQEVGDGQRDRSLGECC